MLLRHVAALLAAALLALPAAAQDALPTLEGTDAEEEKIEEAESTPDEGGWIESAARGLFKRSQDGERQSLQRALRLPEWIEVTLDHRTRFGALDEEFRTGDLKSHNQLLEMRTLLMGTVRRDRIRIGVEGQDSRAYGGPSRGFIDNTIVNTFEPLQAFVGVRDERFGREGDSIDFKFGRQTIDIGSRRLIARNRFRNTINAFTGVRGKIETKEGVKLDSFFLFPMRRQPNDPDKLRSNTMRLDDQLWQTRFWGAHVRAPVTEHLRIETYGYKIDESDGRELATRDRDFWTFGARVVDAPEPGEVDFEWESAIQVGESKLAASTDPGSLTHAAHFHHLSIGYQFDRGQRPHLEAVFDYASGDKNPNDSRNNRFDSLFGARRFEYGPTGIYGVFSRSNLISPGLRLTTFPDSKTEVMAAMRAGWLASRKDQWAASGLQDPAGNSGRHIGELLEVRVRHDIVPGSWQVEVGAAHFIAGSFVDSAPNNTGQGDSTYVYASTRFWF